jgi:hypothetical protein
MSNDDEFVVRLRHLADETPVVVVDRVRVLELGRRQRAGLVARAGVATVAAAVALTVGVTVLVDQHGGPSAPAGPSTSVSPVPTPSAANPVDHEAGTITLPLDLWMWSAADQATSDTAVELATAQCMAAAGMGDEFKFLGPFPVQPERGDYGVWQRETVEESGYTSLLVDDSRPGTGLRGDDPRIQTQRDCFGAAFAAYSYNTETFAHTAPAGHEAPGYLPEGIALLDEWRQCMTEHGVPTASGGTTAVPDGALTAPMAEQVRVGLIDVACKDEMNFVERFAQVDAAEQLDFIARAEPFLTELRAEQQRALAAARTLLVANGISVPGA